MCRVVQKSSVVKIIATAVLFGWLSLEPPIGISVDNTKDQLIVIRGGTLIDGAGGKPIKRAVIVTRNGKIAAVFSEGEAEVPSGARVIDATNMTILPGLIDMHVHLGGSGGARVSIQEFAGGRLEHDLAAYLFCGVTSIRSLGDTPNLAFGLKRLQSTGEIHAPHLLVAGSVFTAPGGYPVSSLKVPPASMPYVVQVSDEFEAKNKVRELVAEGADLIKVIYDGGNNTHTYPRLSQSVLKSLIVEAHMAGLPVSVHTGSCSEVRDAVLAGADGVEHGVTREPIDDETVRLLVKHKSFYCPTLAVLEGPLRIAAGFRPEQDRLVNQTTRLAVWESINSPGSITSRLRSDETRLANRKRMLQQAMNNLTTVYKAGVRIALGTDSGNEATFHGSSVHRELQLMVQAGVPPMQVIVAATSLAARYARIDSEFGAIKVGKYADLLIVTGNPLKDISATTLIFMVIRHGKIINREHLLEVGLNNHSVEYGHKISLAAIGSPVGTFNR